MRYKQEKILTKKIKSWLQLNDFEVKKGKKLGVTISFNNHRLFVGNIPKTRDRNEIFDEFCKYARKFLNFLFFGTQTAAKIHSKTHLANQKKKIQIQNLLTKFEKPA